MFMSMIVKDDDMEMTGKHVWMLPEMFVQKFRMIKKFEQGYVAPAPCIYNCGRCPGGEVWSPFTMRCVNRRI